MARRRTSFPSRCLGDAPSSGRSIGVCSELSAPRLRLRAVRGAAAAVTRVGDDLLGDEGDDDGAHGEAEQDDHRPLLVRQLLALRRQSARQEAAAGRQCRRCRHGARAERRERDAGAEGASEVGRRRRHVTRLACRGRRRAQTHGAHTHGIVRLRLQLRQCVAGLRAAEHLQHGRDVLGH